MRNLWPTLPFSLLQAEACLQEASVLERSPSASDGSKPTSGGSTSPSTSESGEAGSDGCTAAVAAVAFAAGSAVPEPSPTSQAALWRSEVDAHMQQRCMKLDSQLQSYWMQQDRLAAAQQQHNGMW
jgi:hypothetical protein